MKFLQYFFVVFQQKYILLIVGNLSCDFYYRFFQNFLLGNLLEIMLEFPFLLRVLHQELLQTISHIFSAILLQICPGISLGILTWISSEIAMGFPSKIIKGFIRKLLQRFTQKLSEEFRSVIPREMSTLYRNSSRNTSRNVIWNLNKDCSSNSSWDFKRLLQGFFHKTNLQRLFQGFLIEFLRRVLEELCLLF